VVGLLLAALCIVAAAGASAPAQSPQAKLERTAAKLDRVQREQGGLEATIARQNAEIDQLIGEVSALRQREAAVELRLGAKQAELERANAELAAERRHLAAVRSRLRRSLGALRQLLVGIYESGSPDVVSIILESSSWSDLLAGVEYVERVRSYEDTVVERVRAVRDEARAAVLRLRGARKRIRSARDAIASEERELASARASVQVRHAEFVAMRGERQRLLDSLVSREEALADNLAAISAQAEGAPFGPAPPPPGPGQSATLLSSGQAVAPVDAPNAVVGAIDAANRIAGAPYVWGGGHGSFDSSGYDCSGAVSYALNGGGLLSSPLDSTGLQTWGSPGPGSWITVYANPGHTFVVIAGLRWDTSDTGGSGPSWHADMRSTAGFIARHPAGY
jgi:cell wall-associated NlpC family hydrolase